MPTVLGLFKVVCSKPWCPINQITKCTLQLIFFLIYLFFYSFYLPTTVLPPTILVSVYDGLIGT